MPPKRQAAAASESKKRQLPRKLTCPYDGCDKTRDDESDMRRHIEAVHLGVKHHCTFPGCSKKYASSAALGHHVSSVHQGIRHRCQTCGKDFLRAGSLFNYIKQIYEAVKYPCPYEDCDKEYTHKENQQQHIQSKHQGVTRACTVDDCQKIFGSVSGLRTHIASYHKGIRFPCPFSDCDRQYTCHSDRSRHVKVAHLGRRYSCPFLECQKTFTGKVMFDKHLKSAHGSPEEEAELRQKKLELYQFLADKEARGVCSFTKTCKNLATDKDSFHCRHHQKSVNIITTVLEEKRIAGKLSASSITSSDEFALLLQRPKISLDSTAKASLRLLTEGLDGVHGSSTFAMNSEFIYVKQFIPLDITVARGNGDIIISIRIDYGMSLDDLEAVCLHPVSRANVRKVYDKSSKTWSKIPKEVIKILQDARISSDAII